MSTKEHGIPELPMKILIPVDGSESSSRAIDYALLLAKKLQASVVFVHVIEFPSISSRYALATELQEEVRREGVKLLKDSLAMAVSAGVVSAKEVLVYGDPADMILSILKQESCDSIVLGKRGLGRLDRLLMGSVSDKVTKLANVPVTIVR
ncbi:MAG: universal stress protein [Nitrososphaerota archaeon]|nr:universal stress protein [Nitrososphaerota archaeon]MDG6922454.1 universal stress protein [Nitrososphaerota archaeon]